MSVTVVKHQDAIQIIERGETPAQPATRNFFDAFGTTGCLRKCENERTLKTEIQYDKAKHNQLSRKQRKEVSAALTAYLKEAHGGLQDWFKADEINASAAQGCGSCRAISYMVQNSFPGNEQGLSDKYEYSVSRTFELRRRLRAPAGKVPPVEMVQLFQPPSSSVELIGFKTSNFLCGRDVSIARLRRWMDECSSSHEICLATGATQDDNRRPGRLLDITPIQSGSEFGIRLVESPSGSSYHYACLSHRWDDAIHHVRTTTENVLKFQDFLNLNLMPANIRDAVAIARDLKIQYLWIDSLCIIQSGDDGVDLYKELAKMSSIYQNAYLTIAAVSSPSSSEGCFIKDKWPDICFQVVDDGKDAYLIGARVLDKKGTAVSFEAANEHYPLLSRAWVFQERLLSRRLLLCNYGEFAFQCLESSTCECNSSLAPHPRANLGENLKWLGNLDARCLTSSNANLGDVALKSWKLIIETYMQLELSYLSDMLPAVAGCAQVMAKQLNHNYVAGLWEETLPTDLLWYVQTKRHRTVPKPRAEGSTAPSWSWASVSIGQIIRHVDCNLVITEGRWKGEVWLTSEALLSDAIREIHCEPESATNPFGKLKRSYLKLNTVLYPWYLRLYCPLSRRHRTNGSKRQGRYVLYVRTNLPRTCSTEPQELVLDGAEIDIRLDSDSKDEGLVRQSFSDCIGDSTHACRLIPVYLLHALHKENSPRTFDVFILLDRLPPENSQPSCYRRIGLMIMRNEQASGKSWSQITHAQLESRQEEFWLF